MKDEFSALVGRMTKAELESCAARLLGALAGGEKAADAAPSLQWQGDTREGGMGWSDGKYGQPAKSRSVAVPFADMERGLTADGLEAVEAGSPAADFHAFSESASLTQRQGERVEESYAGEKPHRRYESDVGSRELDMSRVSRFFSRDSRRYDSGFEKY